jgi:hypothetical protein
VSVCDDGADLGPRGASEDKALQEVTRRLASVRVFAENLHHDLPAGDRRELARFVRDRLREITDGKDGVRG